MDEEKDLNEATDNDTSDEELAFDEATGEETDGEQQKVDSGAPNRAIFDWVQSVVFAIIFIVLLFATTVRIIGVDGPSMMQTLQDADRIMISKMFYTPKQGDIVVMREESFMNEPIVKRIIALAGQTVDIDFDNHIVYVDGVALDEPYINEPTSLQYDVHFPVTVPEGSMFVLGDNRQQSKDSRASSVGMIDERCIIGRVLFRVYPLTSIGFVK